MRLLQNKGNSSQSKETTDTMKETPVRQSSDRRLIGTMYNEPKLYLEINNTS